MTDLSPEARALLDAARGGDEPSAADRARVHGKVVAAIGAGASGGAGGASASIAKIALAVVVAGGLAVAVYVGLGGGAGSAKIQRAPEPPPPVARVELPAPPPTPAVVAPAPGPVPAPAPAPAPSTSKKHAASAADADTLAAERAILARASAALRAGDAEGALAAVAEHQRRFPSGVLVEERSATRVLALCAAGRTDDGARERDAFLARWPHSVQTARVAGACR